MDIRDTEQRLQDIDTSQGFELIFAILSAYGFPKASISRLRTGGLNSATSANELLWKNRVYFRYVNSADDIHLVIDDAARDETILSKKPRFLMVTNATSLVALNRLKRQTLDIPLVDLARNVALLLGMDGRRTYTGGRGQPPCRHQGCTAHGQALRRSAPVE